MAVGTRIAAVLAQTRREGAGFLPLRESGDFRKVYGGNEGRICCIGEIHDRLEKTDEMYLVPTVSEFVGREIFRPV
ncbi:MAG: hypothetical protein ABI690_22465 [Chloroflexota bacterium]